MSYANAVTVRLCALDHTGFKVQYDLIKSLGNIPAKCAKALYCFLFPTLFGKYIQNPQTKIFHDCLTHSVHWLLISLKNA